ncbi:MAG: hypothetical protein TRG1_1900 [Flavobacteriaceae bacterium FS1-H7996/R]|nr:MAG: hypothetical protein TRG1_1900 [Flavobacteriaceae bacterium FS1-H7996/R]
MISIFLIKIFLEIGYFNDIYQLGIQLAFKYGFHVQKQ